MPATPNARSWEPLDIGSDNDPAWRQRLLQWTWAFVALGVGLRLLRYLLKFPLWGDEMLLAENFIDSGYADCLRPLDNRQCAPLLFLWIELTAIKLLGFSEWPLRLFSALCGIGSVLLFRHVAARLLRGWPLLLAVAIFAVSYYPIRHAAEVKPYASDLAVSLALLALAVEWLRAPQQARWLWLLAAITPLALGLSFPAVFVVGGISLGLAWRVWQAGWPARAAWATYNLVIVGAFLLFAWLSFQGQFDDTGKFMQRYWADSFPPLTEPLKLPGWLLAAHTGEMFAYPIGGEDYGSVLTTLCCAAGTWLLWRRRQWPLLGVFAGVFGLALVAAALRRYPYSETARLVQYLAPPICLLAGTGAATWIALLREARRQRHAALAATGLLCACGLGIAVFDVVHPYKHHVDVVHRGFAQWFWSSQAAGAELVAMPPPAKQTTDSSCGYCAFRCLQRIYAGRPREGTDGAIVAIHFSSTGDQLDESSVATALGDLQVRGDFVAQRRFTVDLTNGRGKEVIAGYDVYEFVRRPDASVARRPAGVSLAPQR